jgi:hypothetical protein
MENEENRNLQTDSNATHYLQDSSRITQTSNPSEHKRALLKLDLLSVNPPNHRIRHPAQRNT